MKFQLIRHDHQPNLLVLTEQCFGVIGTYTTRILVLCHDAAEVAKKHNLELWDDDRVVIPYDFYHNDLLSVNGEFYSDWEIMQ